MSEKTLPKNPPNKPSRLVGELNNARQSNNALHRLPVPSSHPSSTPDLPLFQKADILMFRNIPSDRLLVQSISNPVNCPSCNLKHTVAKDSVQRILLPAGYTAWVRSKARVIYKLLALKVRRAYFTPNSDWRNSY